MRTGAQREYESKESELLRSAVFRDFPNAFSRPIRPFAENLMVQTQKHTPLTLVLPDWRQARRLYAPLRRALIARCIYCVIGDEPSPEVLTPLERIGSRSGFRFP